MKTLLFLFLLCAPLGAQNWTPTIDAEDVIVDSSGTASNVDVLLQSDTLGVEVGGLQLCFSYDAGLVNVFGVQPLSVSNPAFFGSYYANFEDTTTGGGPYGPGVGFGAVLYDFSLVNTLVMDAPTPVLRIQVYSAATAVPGLTTINFVEGLHLPGTFTTRNEVSYLDPVTGNASSSTIPDFPAPVLLFEHPTFKRGDANNNGLINLTDPVYILQVAFGFPVPPPGCFAAMDVNGDGTWEPLPDVLYLLAWMFQGGPPMPGGPVCTTQDDLGLTCDASACP